jgi:hypothetical protein
MIIESTTKMNPSNPETIHAEGVMTMQNQEACFCQRDLISTCTARGHQQQQDCRFYFKSSHNNRCMYYTFDEYCDCVEAQCNAMKEAALLL